MTGMDTETLRTKNNRYMSEARDQKGDIDCQKWLSRVTWGFLLLAFLLFQNNLSASPLEQTIAFAVAIPSSLLLLSFIYLRIGTYIALSAATVLAIFSISIFTYLLSATASSACQGKVLAKASIRVGGSPGHPVPHYGIDIACLVPKSISIGPVRITHALYEDLEVDQKVTIRYHFESIVNLPWKKLVVESVNSRAVMASGALGFSGGYVDAAWSLVTILVGFSPITCLLWARWSCKDSTYKIGNG